MPPKLTSITPTSGSHNGGEKAVLSGASLLSTEEVKFGETDAPDYTVNGDGGITVNSTPPGTKGLKVPVKVFKDGEWSNHLDYTYT